MTTNRPPSCDLPPEQKPCPRCGFIGTEVIEGSIDYQGYCPVCQMKGPDRATEIFAVESWNSIPRRSEVLGLLRLVDEVTGWENDLIDTNEFSEDGEAMINDIGNLREYANKLRKGDEIVSCNNKPPMTVWLTGKQTPCEATNEQHDVFSPYGPYVHLEQFMEKYYGH